MSEQPRWWAPGRAGGVIGRLLQVGVLVAGLVVVAGGVLYNVRHGGEPPQLHAFHGEPSDLRTPTGILQDTLALRGRGIIQLGLLILIATPVARVALSVLVFALERDANYVAVTLFVLGLLLFSLFASG